MSVLQYCCDLVRKLEPGQAITIEESLLSEIGFAPLVGIMGPMWNPVEQIMENVVGSAWEIRTTENFADRSVTFYRCREPSESPMYVSPDRTWT